MHIHHVFPYDPRRLGLTLDEWWASQLQRWPLAALRRTRLAADTTVHVISRRPAVLQAPFPLLGHGTAYDNMSVHGWGDDWSRSLGQALQGAGHDDAVVVHLNDYAAARLSLRASWNARRAIVFHGKSVGRVDQHVRTADALVVLNEESARALTQHGIPDYVIHQVVPSIDRGLFRYGSGPRRATPLRIGFVGRLEETKGIYSLPAVLRAISNRPVQLECIGPVAPRQRERIAAEFQDTPVRLLGHQPPEVVSERMREWNVLALPSYTEGMPLVALEALSSGLPIAGVDGVLPEALTRRKGVFTAPRVNFAQAVEQALANGPVTDADWIPDHAEGGSAWDSIYDTLPAWTPSPRLSRRPWAGRVRRARWRARH